MSLKHFDPDAFLENWSDEKFSPLHSNKTLYQCICESFGIDPKDDYVYRAMAETTLLHMQKAIAAGGQNNMHDWYHDEEGKLVCIIIIVLFSVRNIQHVVISFCPQD